MVAPRYLIGHDPTQRDMQEAARWVAIYQAEVERVVRVLAYWEREVMK